MNLNKFFKKYKVIGVLTAVNPDKESKSFNNATPYPMDDGSLAFIMKDKFPDKAKTTYTFWTDTDPYSITEDKDSAPYTYHFFNEIILTKIKQEENPDLIETLKNRTHHRLNEFRIILTEKKKDSKPDKEKFIVYFHIEEIFPPVRTPRPSRRRSISPEFIKFVKSATFKNPHLTTPKKNSDDL
ncbi:MAG: hypothetical protein RBR08_16555 [Desulforegulaceae bacterium]|nr:hypothetical protein [Desulforegulaceae bacterium]